MIVVDGQPEYRYFSIQVTSATTPASGTSACMGKGKNLKKALQNEKQRSLERARAAQLATASQAEVARPVRKASTSKHSTAQASRKQYNPYWNGERVLFVGEGDLSFAVAWAERYPASAKRSIATCFDSLDAAKAKYTKLEQNVEAVRGSAACIMRHG